jgi:hypothetical protein
VRVIPLFAFSEDIRKVIYTPNAMQYHVMPISLPGM